MTKKLLIALFVIGCLVPLGLAIGYSVFYSVGLAGLLSSGFTFDHWITLFGGEFLQSILYSIWVAAASTLLAMIISLTLLFTARKLFRSRNLYRALFLPLTIPPIVLAFVIFQLYSGAGLFSRLAFQLGFISEIQQFPALVQDPYAVGIIMAHVFLVFPFFLLVLLNLYEHEKLDQIEAVASSLGAGKRTILFQLQLPVLLRGMFPLIALYFIFFMGAYDIPLLLGQSSPHMISVLILENLQRYNLANIPVAHSMAVWYAALCIGTISWLFSRYRRKVAL